MRDFRRQLPDKPGRRGRVYCPRSAAAAGLANASSRRSTCASTGLARSSVLADDHLHGAIELDDAIVEREARLDQVAQPLGQLGEALDVRRAARRPQAHALALDAALPRR